MRAYTVAAIFQVGMNEYDSGYVFLPLESAQIFFQQPNQVTQIEVSVDDPDQARPIGRAILQAGPHTPVRIVDWQQTNNSFFAAVKVEQNVMFLILTLIILVAAFNVVSVADHDGEGQDPRHRRAAHHRRRPRCDTAHLPDGAAPRSGSPAPWSARCWGCCSA